MVQVSVFKGESFIRRAVGIFLLPFLLAGCGGTVPSAAETMAVPGVIWDATRDRPMKQVDLLQQLRGAQVVLLGEIHDNPEHHAIQAEVLRSLAMARQVQTLAMEMLDREQQALVDSLLAENADAARFLEATGFDSRGWGAALYAPVIEVALETELDVAAANLSRAEAGQVMRDGLDGVLGSEAVARLALAGGLPAPAEARLREQLVVSHCNALPEAMLPAMLDAQRARDAVLADVVLGRSEGGVALVTGAKHVRADYGVPHYLALRAPGLQVASVLLIEVDGMLPVESYRAAWQAEDGSQLYDYVWFTPQSERPDPCEVFRQMRQGG